MIQHLILWKLKDEIPSTELPAVKSGIRNGLEGLAGKIPGLVSIRVQTVGLEGSTADVMLDSVFESMESLNAYKTHPLHVEVADTFVRPFTKTRLCLNFEEAEK